MHFSQNIDGFRQNDSQLRLLVFIQLYKQNLLEKVFIFTIYQNYTLALKHSHQNNTNIIMILIEIM